MQQVLHEFVQQYNMLVQQYADNGDYPINGPMEIRVTGLDHAADVGLAGAQDTALSAVIPDADHPEWDVAVWLDLLTIPGTPTSGAFYAELEDWIFTNYSGDYATVRVEWSKGWGYTAAGPWTSARVINELVPESLNTGRPSDANWDTSVATLQQLDPHGIFRNPFLDRLMPRT